ncbi:MAG: hypothetical protein NVS9B15_20750 [Acidobacteriaceae bacterium]
MLDVHPPHAPTHTWKDFFIHIATICVGLLIAVGLEQTVAAFHHASERRELMEEMRQEAERNIAVLRTDLDSDIDAVQWYTSIITDLRASSRQKGFVTVVLPSRTPVAHRNYPARAVWASAKANGKVGLLSDRQSAIYDRLDYNAEMATQEVANVGITLTRVKADTFRLGIHLSPGTTIRLAAGEVSNLSSDLAQAAAAGSSLTYWDSNWLAACEAVADSVQDREDFNPYFIKEGKALSAREPLTSR